MLTTFLVAGAISFSPGQNRQSLVSLLLVPLAYVVLAGLLFLIWVSVDTHPHAAMFFFTPSPWVALALVAPVLSSILWMPWAAEVTESAFGAKLPRALGSFLGGILGLLALSTLLALGVMWGFAHSVMPWLISFGSVIILALGLGLFYFHLVGQQIFDNPTRRSLAIRHFFRWWAAGLLMLCGFYIPVLHSAMPGISNVFMSLLLQPLRPRNPHV